ncbi:hypothetical protein B0H21DRAFT_732126 [Amylocystis lapponica]|nr:hypothetical protein B0H21DRAFT_732126 [Amylocystis lapponica]
MSFENASVTKGLMLSIALTSITAGIFDVKHYLHFQLVPHLSKYHQYWRLFSHNIACANSSDLFLIEMLLYNAGVQIERAFGSAKFASFIVVTTMVSIVFTFLLSLMLHASRYLGSLFNYIPSGPMSVIFSLIYQYSRLVPTAYQFKVFGLGFNDKIWVYAVAAQLALSHTPSTLLPTVVGLLSGYIYRSDLLQLKGWRIPHRVVAFAEIWVKPLLGEGRALRRTNRVMPEQRNRRRTERNRATDEEDTVTTARRPRAARSQTGTPDTQVTDTPANSTEDATPEAGATGGQVMRQWMSELAGGARPSAGGVGTVRAPSESEIQMLVGMFPDVGREVILGVLQRSPNIEAAAETLLTSQT